MKALILVAALLALPITAVGFECPVGKEGPLQPVRWSAEAASFVGVDVRLGVQNTLDKPIRMTDAAVWFVDGLDRSISDKGFEIDPDLTIAAGGAIIMSATYPLGADRLLSARFEDFTAHICTKAVLFEDGSKAEF